MRFTTVLIGLVALANAAVPSCSSFPNSACVTTCMQNTGLDKYACRKSCRETKQSLCSKSCSTPQTREFADGESVAEKRQITSPCAELCLARPECAEARSVITGDGSAPAKSFEKRQFSPCVQACLEELGIWDGKARSICKEQCGEARVKRDPISAPVAAAPAERRQIQWSECVLGCVEELGIRDGKGYVYCQRQCGERE
ncbi:hypothetical protein CGLO_05806 [Colletotrichum gloeosporioides Cg-14]|uniref:Uncharacterized protein n=1 Tax=Colletotrichum gloeosporioides (strain Cg-14) TaxID=1237896 RepID=T0KPA9_COLGC|nr:hypothetical protein CGLO_05806 [Colletotrichum gloeosporioides Cg-14]